MEKAGSHHIERKRSKRRWSQERENEEKQRRLQSESQQSDLSEKAEELKSKLDEDLELVDDSLEDNEDSRAALRRLEGLELMRTAIWQEIGYIAVHDEPELPVAS